MEKPTKVEIGQRWDLDDGFHSLTITGKRSGGVFGEGKDCKHCLSKGIKICGGWYEETILCGTFMGMAASAEPDWSKWLPPAPLPDTGPKKFRTGQIWANRWKAGYAMVFRVGTVDAENDQWFTRDLLANEGWGVGESGRIANNEITNRAVLVQDVGQADPTPPEVLYGTIANAPPPKLPLPKPLPPSHPNDQTPASPRAIRHEVSQDGKNWVDYARLGNADEPAPPIASFPWRRTWESCFGEVRYTLDAFPAPKPDPGRAETAGDLAGAAAAALVSR